MRVSTMIRGGAVGLVIAAVAACSDAPVMPRLARNNGLQPSAAFSASRGSMKGAPRALSNPRLYADSKTPLDSTTFTLTSNGGLFSFGAHVLYVAKGALCDISSPYGMEYFNDAATCVQPAAPIQVTAYYGTRHGRAYVEFEPALRFNPGDKAPQAILSLFNKGVDKNDKFQILWRNEDGIWIDEALTDPTLQTFELGRDVVARRIKHFSGYNVSASYSGYNVSASIY